MKDEALEVPDVSSSKRGRDADDSAADDDGKRARIESADMVQQQDVTSQAAQAHDGGSNPNFQQSANQEAADPTNGHPAGSVANQSKVEGAEAPWAAAAAEAAPVDCATETDAAAAASAAAQTVHAASSDAETAAGNAAADSSAAAEEAAATEGDATAADPASAPAAADPAATAADPAAAAAAADPAVATADAPPAYGDPMAAQHAYAYPVMQARPAAPRGAALPLRPIRVLQIYGAAELPPPSALVPDRATEFGITKSCRCLLSACLSVLTDPLTPDLVVRTPDRVQPDRGMRHQTDAQPRHAARPPPCRPCLPPAAAARQPPYDPYRSAAPRRTTRGPPRAGPGLAGPVPTGPGCTDPGREPHDPGRRRAPRATRPH
jgi:hypothetical protein